VTTHVDRHNERFAMSALEGMVNQANSSYIPMGVEHDPRFPPMGRITHAEISPLPDGEYAVKATFELFDVDTLRSDARRSIPLDVREIERFDVAYDRTSQANDARGDIAALAGLAGSEPREMGKKSVEPLAAARIVPPLGRWWRAGRAPPLRRACTPSVAEPRSLDLPFRVHDNPGSGGVWIGRRREAEHPRISRPHVLRPTAEGVD